MFKRNRDRIPVDMTPDGVRFRRERSERNKSRAFIALGSIGIISAGVYFFGQSKQVSFNKPPVPLTEVQKFRKEINDQTGGKDLLADVDNEKNSKVTPEQFATTARQFYLLRKSCLTNSRILTEPNFNLGVAVYSEGDKDLLVMKSKGITEVTDITKFNRSLENLNTQCNTLSPYIDSGLSELVLTGRQSKNLIADPNNPKAFGVEPGGYFSPMNKSIHLSQESMGDNDIFPHETMHRLADKYKIASMESAKVILGEKLFNKWRGEGFVDNHDTVQGKKISVGLNKEMESIGLREYSLYMMTNPNVKKFYDKNEELKRLEKELDVSKKSPSIQGKKIVLVESANVKNAKLRKVELTKELEKLESKLPPPQEMLSTPIEIIFDINDPRFKDPKVKAMIGRYLDLMYAKTKFEIFSPKIRGPWIEMVRAVNKNINNLEKVNQIIAEFDKKYPDLKKK
jgi:hypothetical protein